MATVVLWPKPYGVDESTLTQRRTQRGLKTALNGVASQTAHPTDDELKAGTANRYPYLMLMLKCGHPNSGMHALDTQEPLNSSFALAHAAAISQTLITMRSSLPAQRLRRFFLFSSINVIEQGFAYMYSLALASARR